MTDTDKDIEQLQARIEAAKRRKEHDAKVQELQRQLAELEGPHTETPVKKPGLKMGSGSGGSGLSMPQLPPKAWMGIIGVGALVLLYLVNKELAIGMVVIGGMGAFMYFKQKGKKKG